MILQNISWFIHKHQTVCLIISKPFLEWLNWNVLISFSNVWWSSDSLSDDPNYFSWTLSGNMKIYLHFTEMAQSVVSLPCERQGPVIINNQHTCRCLGDRLSYCINSHDVSRMALTHWGREKNGHHFPDDIVKWIFLNENVSILIDISLKVVPKGPNNNIPALV